MSAQGRVLAAEVLHLIERFHAPRVVALDALNRCRDHLENRSKVETAALVAGCRLSGFLWNEDLELYYDVSQGDRDVAYISKGWNEPGFRIGDCVLVSDSRANRLDELKAFCDASGVVMSVRQTDSADLEVNLDQVIYATGFDGRTLARALATLVDCLRRLKSL